MTAMAETASETISIAAPPDRVWAIAADVERYPDWVRDVKDVVVRSRDEQQRPSEVEFRASALGRSTHYTLAYDYSQAPEVLAWKMVKGDIQRSIEGAYHLTPDGRRRHRGALRPGDRAGRAAARLRQAAGRGAHPQLGARAEDPRRGRDRPAPRHRRRRHEVPRRRDRRRRCASLAETPRADAARRRRADRRPGRDRRRPASRPSARSRPLGVGAARADHARRACCSRRRTSPT